MPSLQGSRDNRLSQTNSTSQAKPRTASKQERKAQLIKATIRSIAKHGLSLTTMASVASEAGLSQGIINLHFQSKDRLLEETLRYVADEYRQTWQRVITNTDNNAADKLKALVKVDFDKKIVQRKKLAVWFAFWGESRSRPVYRNICSAGDEEFRQVVSGLCKEIIKEGNYEIRADFVVYGLTAMNEGLWLDLLLNSPEMTPELGYEISMAYLQGMFPQHYP